MKLQIKNKLMLILIIIFLIFFVLSPHQIYASHNPTLSRCNVFKYEEIINLPKTEDVQIIQHSNNIKFLNVNKPKKRKKVPIPT
ncbi:MAG: hypothetical protein ACQBVK_05530 [Candidatus Phytoplasma sp. TWB_XP]